jgi:hypothetical protein
MTLESQYKDYLKDHPDSTYTFDEWKENVFHPMLEKLIIMSQEYDRELKDWDNTLMDGLEDLPWED